MDQPVLKFWSNFWPMFWITWRSTTFGCAVGVLASTWGIPIEWELRLLAVLAGGLVGGVIMGLPLALAILYFPVYVAVDGIKCYDFWGIYHFAPWETIERVRP